MTAIQGQNQLAKDAPDEALLGSLAFQLQVLDDTAQVAVAAVFHV